MIKVTILAVGKLKEKYFTDACNEYIKRLGRFCKLNVVEVEPTKISDNPSEREIENCIQQEGERILNKIPSDAFVTAMCIEGDMKDSETLSSDIMKSAVLGKSNQFFIIGGSYGLSPQVKSRADKKLSMSRMTFPHKLARVMLLEQIYRAFMISEAGTYHK